MTDETTEILRLTERVACAGWSVQARPRRARSGLSALTPPTTAGAGGLPHRRRCRCVPPRRTPHPRADRGLLHARGGRPRGLRAIAAANALSDVYAMGGRRSPPSPSRLSGKGLPAGMGGGHRPRRIPQAAGSRLRAAGRHSVRDPRSSSATPSRPGRLGTHLHQRRRAGGAGPGAHEGLGTGVIATALKAGHAPADAVETATRSMAPSTEGRRRPRCATARPPPRTSPVRPGRPRSGIARQSRVNWRSAPRTAVLVCCWPRARSWRRASSRVAEGERKEFEPHVEYRTSPTTPSARCSTTPRRRGLLLAVAEKDAAALAASCPGPRQSA